MLWNFIEVSLYVLVGAGSLIWIAIFLIWFWGLLKEIAFPELSAEKEDKNR